MYPSTGSITLHGFFKRDIQCIECVQRFFTRRIYKGASSDAAVDPVTFTANRTGSKRSRWRTNSDRVLPIRGRFDGWPPGFKPVPVDIRSKLTARIKFNNHRLPVSIRHLLRSALAEKIPFQSEHWTPEWVNQYFSGASRAMRRKLASWSLHHCMTSLTRQLSI